MDKVDTLDNVADSLKKYVSIEKFSWCREAIGIYALDCQFDKDLVPPICKENNKWENVGHALYSL